MKRNLTKRQQLTRRIYEDAKQAVANARWQESLAHNESEAARLATERAEKKNRELLATNVTKNPWENHFTVCIRVDYKTYEQNRAAFEAHIAKDVITNMIDFIRKGPQ